MKKISIIIPVYNVERYLNRCIDSIVGQGFSSDKYELIVVNDGSTDSSRQILEELQAKYPIVVVDKENGGLSSARNEGLKHATGDYIFFVDSDDWIAEGSLEFLSDWVEKHPVDILLFGICEIDDNNRKKTLLTSLSPNNQVLNVPDYLCNYTLRSSAWQGLFARHLFTDSGLRFKHGFISEDDDFVVRVFSRAQQVVCNSRQVYYYYQRAGSISKSRGEVAVKLIDDKLIMLEDLNSYIKVFDGKRRRGLQRKLDFLAVDIIRMLIRQKHTSATINRALDTLKSIGYYPLKKSDYGKKYSLFRTLFASPYRLRMARSMSKYI